MQADRDDRTLERWHIKKVNKTSGVGDSKNTFRPDIEGLRGLAILAVVIFHVGMTWLGNGFLGVDMFFVLSGFLISGILLKETETGHLDLANFYARRMRRLLPAALTVIVITLVASMFIFRPYFLVGAGNTAASSAGYLANFHFLSRSQDYFAAEAVKDPFLHMWSLAVEEQFYLIWPGLIWLVARGAKKEWRAMGLLGGVFGLSLYFYLRAPETTAFYRPDLRAWEFAAGAMVSLFKWPASLLIKRRGNVAMLVGAIGLCAVGAALFWGHTLGIVLGTALILMGGNIDQERGVSLFLARPFWRFMGKYSYSWYLWHWPFLILGVPLVNQDSILVRIILVSLALVLAIATYHFLENPIRTGRLLFFSPKKTIYLGLGASLVVVLGSSLASRYYEKLTESNQDGFTSKNLEGRTWQHGWNRICNNRAGVLCRAGDSLGGKKIFLWGDSHAIQWMEVVNELALQNNWRLIAAGYMGCPPGEFAKGNDAEKKRCQAWNRKVLDSLINIRPNLVLLGYANLYVEDKSNRKKADASKAEWKKRLEQVVEVLSAAGIPVIIIQDIPYFKQDPLECLIEPMGDVNPKRCETLKKDAFNWTAREIEEDLARANKNVKLLNLDDQLCPGETCPVIVDGKIFYANTNHIAPYFAKKMSPYILDFIKKSGFMDKVPQ